MVPVESRKARAMASGISFGLQESCGVSKTAVRGPSSTAVTRGVFEPGWESAERTVWAAQSVARAKAQKTGSARLVTGFLLNSVVGRSSLVVGRSSLATANHFELTQSSGDPL